MPRLNKSPDQKLLEAFVVSNTDLERLGGAVLNVEDVWSIEEIVAML